MIPAPSVLECAGLDVGASRPTTSETDGMNIDVRAGVLARFWGKVNKGGPIHPTLGTECWLWTAYRNAGGYGQFHAGRSNFYAHRFAYETMVGRIADGIVLRHQCDTPACVNPAHMLLGTHAENVADKVRRGRVPNGEAHCSHLHPERVPFGEDQGNAKLSEEQAREILKARMQGESHGSLARRFGVGRTAISNLCSGRRWGRMEAERPPRFAVKLLGSDVPSAVLNEARVREIRAAAAGGERIASIARRLAMSPSQISNIVHRRQWRHVS